MLAIVLISRGCRSSVERMIRTEFCSKTKLRWTVHRYLSSPVYTNCKEQVVQYWPEGKPKHLIAFTVAFCKANLPLFWIGFLFRLKFSLTKYLKKLVFPLFRPVPHFTPPITERLYLLLGAVIDVGICDVDTKNHCNHRVISKFFLEDLNFYKNYLNRLKYLLPPKGALLVGSRGKKPPDRVWILGRVYNFLQSVLNREWLRPFWCQIKFIQYSAIWGRRRLPKHPIIFKQEIDCTVNSVL